MCNRWCPVKCCLMCDVLNVCQCNGETGRVEPLGGGEGDGNQFGREVITDMKHVLDLMP